MIVWANTSEKQSNMQHLWLIILMRVLAEQRLTN